jgi:hypothetical protein
MKRQRRRKPRRSHLRMLLNGAAPFLLWTVGNLIAFAIGFCEGVALDIHEEFKARRRKRDCAVPKRRTGIEDSK